MNVVLISPFPPEIDGLAPYARDLKNAYETAGHRVLVLDTGRSAESRAWASLTVNPVVTIGQLFRLVKARPDLIHVQHTIAGFGALLPALWTVVLAARITGSQVVVTHHEATRDIDRLGLIARLYYAVCSRIATTVHVHTRGAQDALQALPISAGDRVLVFPLPVYAMSPDPAQADELRSRFGLGDRIVLMHFGFIQTEKGIDTSIAAYGDLLRRRPDLAETTVLVVAGDVRERPAGFARFEAADRAYSDELRAAVAAACLSGQVVFTGSVPEDEVAAWFTLAQLVLLPYEKTEQSAVANQAVACDVPVLATRRSGLEELLGALPMLEETAAESYSRRLEDVLDQLGMVTQQARVHFSQLRAAGDVNRLVMRLTNRVDDVQLSDRHPGMS